MLLLQRSIGKQAVTQLIQAKLKVGSPYQESPMRGWVRAPPAAQTIRAASATRSRDGSDGA